jgi:hypothetical protein
MAGLRVEIKDPTVREHKGTSAKTGKPYNMREQSGWADLGKAYPVEVRFLLRDNQVAFGAGTYDAGVECFWLDRRGNLSFDLSKMRPAVKPQVVAPPARAL